MGARTTPVESAQTLPARNGFEVTILPGSTSRFCGQNVVTPPKSRKGRHPAKEIQWFWRATSFIYEQETHLRALSPSQQNTYEALRVAAAKDIWLRTRDLSAWFVIRIKAPKNVRLSGGLCSIGTRRINARKDVGPWSATGWSHRREPNNDENTHYEACAYYYCFDFHNDSFPKTTTCCWLVTVTAIPTHDHVYVIILTRGCVKVSVNEHWCFLHDHVANAGYYLYSWIKVFNC